MTLLLFCMAIMRAPTIPSPESVAGDGGSGLAVTFLSFIPVCIWESSAPLPPTLLDSEEAEVFPPDDEMLLTGGGAAGGGGGGGGGGAPPPPGLDETGGGGGGPEC